MLQLIGEFNVTNRSHRILQLVTQLITILIISFDFETDSIIAMSKTIVVIEATNLGITLVDLNGLNLQDELLVTEDDMNIFHLLALRDRKFLPLKVSTSQRRNQTSAEKSCKGIDISANESRHHIPMVRKFNSLVSSIQNGGGDAPKIFESALCHCARSLKVQSLQLISDVLLHTIVVGLICLLLALIDLVRHLARISAVREIHNLTHDNSPFLFNKKFLNLLSELKESYKQYKYL